MKKTIISFLIKTILSKKLLPTNYSLKDSMQFSEVIAGVCSAIFSKDSSCIAISNGSKVIVKDTKEMMNKSIFSFQDTITHMEFSPDNTMLLAVLSNSSYVEVKSFYSEQQMVKITDSACGILHAAWAPNSKAIIVFSDFQMKATIYDFAENNQYIIKNPKFPEKGISFTSDGKLMALAERRDVKDYIGIYSTHDWKLVNHFAVDSIDLQDISWSNDDQYILVWDSQITYKLLVYHPTNGVEHKILNQNDHSLGIKCVEQAQGDKLLAVGGLDDKIRLVNTLTWKTIIELEHKQNLKEYSQLIVYREAQQNNLNALSIADRSSTQFVVDDQITKLNSIKTTINNQSGELKSCGIQEVKFSVDSNYIASRSATFQNAVFIWETNTLELKVILIFLQSVKGFVWSNHSTHLLIYSGSNKIFFWSDTGASVCELPGYGKLFNVHRVLWNSNSKCLVLLDKRDGMIGYPPLEMGPPDGEDRNL